jgi:FKBP12-rapamycin complex-associated protein
MRDNRDSVMAMLEAFVYDPLISWRLLGKGDDSDMKLVSRVTTTDEVENSVDKLRDQLGGTTEKFDPVPELRSDNELSPRKFGGSSVRENSAFPTLRRSKSQEGTNPEDEPFQENLNARFANSLFFFVSLFRHYRAIEVINRIQSKLTGRDFMKYDDVGEDLSVEQQVDRLIKEATSVENLCQLFSGWCALW